MNVEFRVQGDGDTWSVRRGSTAPLTFSSEGAAIAAAEGLARSAAAHGEKACVRILRDFGEEERWKFAPDPFTRREGVKYEPEADARQG